MNMFYSSNCMVMKPRFPPCVWLIPSLLIGTALLRPTWNTVIQWKHLSPHFISALLGFCRYATRNKRHLVKPSCYILTIVSTSGLETSTACQTFSSGSDYLRSCRPQVFPNQALTELLMELMPRAQPRNRYRGLLLIMAHNSLQS